MNIAEMNKAHIRRMVVLGGMLLAMALLVLRAADLQIMNRDFLQNQGDARTLRTMTISAHRGMITDRNGEPLAISTPVETVWANPQELAAARKQWGPMLRLLDLDRRWLEQRLAQYRNREFMYLKRHLDPQLAEQVMALGIPGVALQTEYRRYYPAGEVTAHIIGFTNVDDAGQEGIELAYESTLRGIPGSMRVIKDRLGRIVETVEQVKEPVSGQALALSIDRRIQYLAYRSLKEAVLKHHAASGSALILDVHSGEVLAMVNQPSFNPNNRDNARSQTFRNRAVTDVFEPGSTVKAFTVVAALNSGKFTPHTLIDTSPGLMYVGPNPVRDIRNHGMLDVTGVIQKSSNIGVTKMAMIMTPEQLWKSFNKVGFGQVSGSGFPGEVMGVLTDYHRWYPIDRATFSFGYGISVTAMQLARAYMTLGNGGYLKPVSLVPVAEAPAGEAVMSAKIASQVLKMLESVTDEGGTGTLAHISGYRVAGKTGTVHKTESGGYAEDRYVALFAGLAPASHPRLAMVVVINDPASEEYYGGHIAAPVFAQVMAGALRLLDIPPDDLPPQGAKIVSSEHLAQRGIL